MRIGLLGHPTPFGDDDNLGLIENRFTHGINKLETICTAGSFQTLGSRTGNHLVTKRSGMHSLDDLSIRNAYGVNGEYGLHGALHNFKLGYAPTEDSSYSNLAPDDPKDTTVGGNGRYVLRVGGVFSGSTANQGKYFDTGENLNYAIREIGEDSTTFTHNGKESGTSVDDHLYWYDTAGTNYYPQFSSAAYSPDGTKLLLMGTIHEMSGTNSYWHDTTAFTYDLSPAYSITNLGGQSAGSGSPVKPYFSKRTNTRTAGSSGPHDSSQATHCCWGSNGNKFYYNKYRSALAYPNLAMPCNTNRPSGQTYTINYFDWRSAHPGFTSYNYTTDEIDYFMTNTGDVENVTSMTFYPRNSGWDNVEIGDIIKIQRNHYYGNSYFSTAAYYYYSITSTPTHNGTNCYMTRSSSPTSYTSFNVSFAAKVSGQSNIPVPDFDISYASGCPTGGCTRTRTSTYRFSREATDKVSECNVSTAYRTNSVTWDVDTRSHNSLRSFFWSDDGYQFYVVNYSNEIEVYDATTPWSLGTLSFNEEISGSPQIDEIYPFTNDSIIDLRDDVRMTEQRLRNF